MDRRSFLKTAGVAGVAGGIAGAPAAAFVPAHNWDQYDFGSGPAITDRLNQGPFPQYPPEEDRAGGDAHAGVEGAHDVGDGENAGKPVPGHDRQVADAMLAHQPHATGAQLLV